jgi:hypothetical protein
MFPYHIAQICTSGHLITDSYDLFEYERRNYCPKCGSPTITSCPSCGAELRGAVEGVICEVPIDAYCSSCGEPFPWTVKALDAVAACIREEEELDAILAEKLIDSLPDIMAETPATNLATIRCKKVLASAGKFTVDAIRQFVIDFGCELAKRSLLP